MIVAEVNGLQLAIVVALFLLVSVLGFAASRWRRAESLDHLDEWGLGGRLGWLGRGRPPYVEMWSSFDVSPPQVPSGTSTTFSFAK